MGRNASHLYRMNQALDDELAAHELAALQNEVRQTQEIAADWDRLRRTDELLRTTPMIHPAAGFADRVMAVLSALPMPGFARRTPSVGIALGLALAALLAIPVLSVGLWLLLSLLTDPGALTDFLQAILDAAGTVLGLGGEVLDAIRGAAGETTLVAALLAALAPILALWVGVLWTVAGGARALPWRKP